MTDEKQEELMKLAEKEKSLLFWLTFQEEIWIIIVNNQGNE